MYFFGLSKEEVLSQKHVVVSYKETSKQNPISMVTLFGRQVYPVKNESSKSGDGCIRINSPELLMKDIDLRFPPDHDRETVDSRKYDGIGCSRNNVELGIHSGREANMVKEVSATNWNGKRNPNIVIDLEELPEAEHADSVSYVTVRNSETKPNLISLNSLTIVDDDKEQCLLDLNRIPADELVSEPHYCFLQDLNCPYIEETETSGIDDGPTPLCSPKSQNVHEKDGTASPASYTSCCTTENNSRTELRRSSSPRALEPACRTKLEFPEEEEEEELSEMIQMAAESLVHISVTSHQNQSKPASRTTSSTGCSCDSYELHTLGINETNIEEDFCVSSKAQDELNNFTRDNNNNKEIGLKLRRGRRMKNFQKEILPSLTSLSRHEICEDINILEAVLRSKEYKKMQGKTKDVKFRTNARNKRTAATQRYVGKNRR